MYGGYSDFQTLAYSRHSVRDFSDKPLSVEKIKKAVFARECEFVCTNFKEYLKKKDRYYFLAKAILNKDYAKYSIYCQEFI